MSGWQRAKGEWLHYSILYAELENCVNQKAMATVALSGCFTANPNNRPKVKNRYKVVGRNSISFTSLKSQTQTERALRIVIRASTEPHGGVMAIEKGGIKIITDPPESKLSELGVRSWPKWGCPPSKFPWTYSSKETCYLLKGKVKVYPDGSNEGVEIGAGDLVEFPKGMSCTWDVSEEVDKHYKFE
ncbi:PREDICTED: uncharacterized protein LOC109176773 [Ipomoea nil]|uniref:uncharacterized protein LOC109176773 n=1 Tax=Ipomoea nil TaxID=35883 RepID=UPI000901328A|nr:PREDICTED: uncharacterized protein LOC109176773 [Ipomoea nil]